MSSNTSKTSSSKMRAGKTSTDGRMHSDIAKPFHRPAEEDTISDSPEEVSDGGFKLTLSLDVSHFKPEELSVNLNEGTLTVEGKQEIKEDDSYSMRSFIRHWELSEDIDINQIHPTLNEDGRLITETAKITKPAVSGRNTPIQKHITENLDGEAAVFSERGANLLNINVLREFPLASKGPEIVKEYRLLLYGATNGLQALFDIVKYHRLLLYSIVDMLQTPIDVLEYIEDVVVEGESWENVDRWQNAE
ncbi:Hsp20/alpha crystallin family protein [Ancylostoma ceylanicum]|uniref:Hsp20/alpha crystallin family protein n=1 Tax=Ancylostoma ceylanicum TaxID=53326 RepID=A0A0D6M432_9BILA|nr:Hsp20/alpha crystallin family protein [Ancylostoma ceylanicum]